MNLGTRYSIQCLEDIKIEREKPCYPQTKLSVNRRIKINKKYLELLEAIEYDFIQNFREVFQDREEGQRYFDLGVKLRNELNDEIKDLNESKKEFLKNEKDLKTK